MKLLFPQPRVCVLAGLLAFIQPCAASPQLIAFVKTDSAQRSDIWTMYADGTHRQRLTNNGHSISPAWFPDGKRLAFVVYRTNDEDDGQIWVMNNDGSGQTQLTRNGDEGYSSPTVSPDGAHIAYLKMKYSPTEGNSDIYLYRMNSDATQQVPLIKAAPFVDRIEYAPSGASILCNGNGGEFGISSIWLYGLAKGRLRNIYPRSLNNHFVINGNAAWSPNDGRFVADAKLWTNGNDDSSHQDLEKRGLLVIDNAGTKIHLVLQGSYTEPSWSKDGRQLVFVGNASSLQTFNLMTHQRRILYRDSGLSSPRWQP